MPAQTINGASFSFNLAGEGGPTVVLETGLGAESSEWGPVEAALAGSAVVFRYDRLGRGESDAPAGPQTVSVIAESLRALLQACGLAPPFVLVGHSFGGLVVQAYAERRPDEVRGLVLAESMHPAQFEVMGPAFPPPSPDDPKPLVEIRRFWTEGWRSPDSTRERIDFLQLQQGGAPAAGDFGDLPLRVLTSGSMGKAPFMPPAAREGLQARWVELQAQLAARSSRTVATSWPAAGHFLQRDNPAAIVAAVQDLIGATA